MLIGRLNQTAEGFDSYEIFEADSSFVFTIATWIQPAFELDAYEMPTFGLDSVYLPLWQGDAINITIGWDNWSGCFVMAHSEAGNELVRHIAAYLDEKLNDIEQGRNSSD